MMIRRVIAHDFEFNPVGPTPRCLVARDVAEGGFTVRRWSELNLFFGGVQAVARNPDTGRLTGGGDPRRGGVATVVG